MNLSNNTKCDSCSGLQVLTPVAPQNHPGQASIGFRSGAYHDFKASMIARLSSTRYAPMAELTTRDENDFTLAIIDAWAVSCDVLSFYSQLWMNESFLPTARETLSLHELASLTGYAPHPGAAASADLLFLMAEEEGAPSQAQIAIGTKVQSTPEQDESPVTFETTEEISARPVWNAMRPKLTASHALNTGTKKLYFSGVSTELKAGDGVFFNTDSDNGVFAIIYDVSIQIGNIAEDPDAQDLTVVSIKQLTTSALHTSPLMGENVSPIVFEEPVENYIGETVDAAELAEILASEGVLESDFFSPLRGSVDRPKEVLVMRSRSAVFGHGAPSLDTLPTSMTGPVPVYDTVDGNIVIDQLVDGPFANIEDADWAEGNLTVLDDGLNNLYLDRVVSEIGAGSHVVLRDGNNWGLYTVDDAAEVSISRFTVTGKSSRLTLDSDSQFSNFSIRGTSVFAAAEWLPLAQRPLSGHLPPLATSISLNQWAPGLQPGRKIMLSGPTYGSPDVPLVRLAEIAQVNHNLSPGKGTTLVFTESLGLEFSLRGLRVHGNIARGTQGESVFDVLGGGDPGKTFQTFSIKQIPQTHVPAATPSGVEPTLEVRVDKLKWQEVESFLHVGPDDRVYTTRVDQDGVTHITFGDGINGARPPAGTDNVRATYRKTHGLQGRVATGQLNLLMSQPLGVTGVNNPLPAEGGADPENISAIRENAPLICRTLERVVSLTDYEDFSRGYAGIAKSQAQWLSIQNVQRVVVSVAGEKGALVEKGGVIHSGLVDAMKLAADPYAKFYVCSYVQRLFKLAVKIKIHPDYLQDEVITSVETALREAFSFTRRQFTQPVFVSEVLEVLQNLGGVEAAIVDRLYIGSVAARNEGIAAAAVQLLPNGEIRGAELLSLHPGPLDYIEVLS